MIAHVETCDTFDKCELEALFLSEQLQQVKAKVHCDKGAQIKMTFTPQAAATEAKAKAKLLTRQAGWIRYIPATAQELHHSG